MDLQNTHVREQWASRPGVVTKSGASMLSETAEEARAWLAPRPAEQSVTQHYAR